MRFTTHCEANERRRPKVRQQVEVSGWDGKRKKRALGEFWEDERKKHSYLPIKSLHLLLRRPLQTVTTTRLCWRLKPSVSDGSTMEASISASAGILNPLMRRYQSSDRLVGEVLHSLWLQGLPGQKTIFPQHLLSAFIPPSVCLRLIPVPLTFMLFLPSAIRPSVLLVVLLCFLWCLSHASYVCITLGSTCH